jgi:hypothetical protein
MSRHRAMREVGGTPIEEAPLWALAIFTVLLWLVVFPAIAGLLAGWGYWHGEKLWTALAALAVAVLIVAGLATRKPWRRPTGADLRDERPVFVRFSTWLWTAILVPNVLFGVLVLTNEGPPLTYQHALFLGALVSVIQGTFALVDRWKRRRAKS